jgi:hypothetical protein
MNRTGSILAALLLIQLAVSGWLYLGDGDEPREAPGTRLASIDTGRADRIVFTDGEASITLARRGDDWVLPEENDLPADSARIDSLFRRMEELSPGFPVARLESSQQQLKVAPDEFERRLTLFAGEEVLAGIYLGTSSGLRESHLRLEDENDIFATRLNSYQLPVRRGEWLDKWILSLEEPERIEGGDFVLSRDGDRWRLSARGENGDLPLDEEIVTEVVEAFQDMAVLDLGEPENPGSLEWKQFRVGSGEQEYTFHIAGDDQAKYVRRDDVGFLFKINDGIHETLEKAGLESLARDDPGESSGDNGDDRESLPENPAVDSTD